MGFRQQPPVAAVPLQAEERWTTTQVHEGIGAYLRECGIEYTLNQADWYVFRWGTTAVTARVCMLDLFAKSVENVVIRLWADVMWEVSPSPQLYRYLLIRNEDFFFGGFSIHEKDNGTVNIYFNYGLLADYLDLGELDTAITMVAMTADRIDEDIKAAFGGQRVLDSL